MDIELPSNFRDRTQYTYVIIIDDVRDNNLEMLFEDLNLHNVEFKFITDDDDNINIIMDDETLSLKQAHLVDYDDIVIGVYNKNDVYFDNIAQNESGKMYETPQCNIIFVRNVIYIITKTHVTYNDIESVFFNIITRIKDTDIPYSDAYFENYMTYVNILGVNIRDINKYETNNITYGKLLTQDKIFNDRAPKYSLISLPHGDPCIISYSKYGTWVIKSDYYCLLDLAAPSEFHGLFVTCYEIDKDKWVGVDVSYDRIFMLIDVISHVDNILYNKTYTERLKYFDTTNSELDNRYKIFIKSPIPAKSSDFAYNINDMFTTGVVSHPIRGLIFIPDNYETDPSYVFNLSRDILYIQVHNGKIYTNDDEYIDIMHPANIIIHKYNLHAATYKISYDINGYKFEEGDYDISSHEELETQWTYIYENITCMTLMDANLLLGQSIYFDRYNKFQKFLSHNDNNILVFGPVKISSLYGISSLYTNVYILDVESNSNRLYNNLLPNIHFLRTDHEDYEDVKNIVEQYYIKVVYMPLTICYYNLKKLFEMFRSMLDKPIRLIIDMFDMQAVTTLCTQLLIPGANKPFIINNRKILEIIPNILYYKVYERDTTKRRQTPAASTPMSPPMSFPPLPMSFPPLPPLIPRTSFVQTPIINPSHFPPPPLIPRTSFSSVPMLSSTFIIMLNDIYTGEHNIFDYESFQIIDNHLKSERIQNTTVNKFDTYSIIDTIVTVEVTVGADTKPRRPIVIPKLVSQLGGLAENVFTRIFINNVTDTVRIGTSGANNCCFLHSFLLCCCDAYKSGTHDKRTAMAYRFRYELAYLLYTTVNDESDESAHILPGDTWFSYMNRLVNYTDKGISNYSLSLYLASDVMLHYDHIVQYISHITKYKIILLTEDEHLKIMKIILPPVITSNDKVVIIVHSYAHYEAIGKLYGNSCKTVFYMQNREDADFIKNLLKN